MPPVSVRGASRSAACNNPRYQSDRFKRSDWYLHSCRRRYIPLPVVVCLVGHPFLDVLMVTHKSQRDGLRQMFVLPFFCTVVGNTGMFTRLLYGGPCPTSIMQHPRRGEPNSPLPDIICYSGRDKSRPYGMYFFLAFVARIKEIVCNSTNLFFQQTI